MAVCECYVFVFCSNHFSCSIQIEEQGGVSHTWQIGGEGVIGWIGQVRDFRNYSLFSYLAASHNLVPLSCSTFAMLQTGETTGGSGKSSEIILFFYFYFVGIHSL